MRTLDGLGTSRGWADRVQAARLALMGSGDALLSGWRAHLQPMLALSRPTAA